MKEVISVECDNGTDNLMTQVLWEYREREYRSLGQRQGKLCDKRASNYVLKGELRVTFQRQKQAFQAEGLQIQRYRAVKLLSHRRSRELHGIQFDKVKFECGAGGVGCDKEEIGEISGDRIMKDLECHG